MQSNLVIQDSDESDGELSDIAIPTKPIQDSAATANTVNTLRDFPPSYQQEQYESNDNNQHDNNNSDQVAGQTINGNGSGIDSYSNNHVTPSFDPNLSVNFDQFLAPQSQDQMASEPASLSQQRRESAWLGEDEGNTSSNPMKLGERGICSSSRRSILKRGRTMDVGNIGVENVVMGVKDVKRRRTMDLPKAFPDAGQSMGFASSPEQGCGVRLEVTSERIAPTAGSLSPAKDNEDSTFMEGLASEAPNSPNSPNNPATMKTVPEPPATFGSEARSRKQQPGRSKSAQGFDDNSYDTKPVSSIVLARAHRTTSLSFISVPPQSSSESTRDELALPPLVQVAITSMSPTAGQKKNPPVAETVVDSDRDELDCINSDYGGMPKERYKPRPSRSRSKASTVDTTMGPEGSENHRVEIVVPCEDFSVPQCQSSKDGESVGAEITNNLEEDTLKGVTQEPLHRHHANSEQHHETNTTKPLDTPRRPVRVTKQKVKRGKTTSVMLSRAVESDIEEDVIWVDEKPANITFKDKKTKNSSSKSRKVECPEERSEKRFANCFEENIQEETAFIVKADERDVKLDEAQQLPPGPSAAAPAPKKRGQKRKQTLDDLTAERLLRVEEAELSIDRKQDTQPFAEQDQNTPAFQKISEEKHSTLDTGADIGPGLKAYQEPQPNEEEHKKPMADALVSSSHPPLSELGLQPSTTPAPEPVETPKKPSVIPQKGPDKHSPIPVNKKIPYRVGLSRSARIAPLLKVVRK
ncbi:hypothetical protein AJ78_02934 [Emergomyces pasteurianus Ep9510]|uniref:Uncharacterized protein n=1 Tax=Emergomyces pasteurianus Ep9510 TaxID=1447872 RepID=A0A1J9PKC7_9EURO|nr:hypothetical protein AJ78_02934 [Emergomyces pasteurianus Ep9510]